jgi:vancomycin permeability regulator SanA
MNIKKKVLVIIIVFFAIIGFFFAVLMGTYYYISHRMQQEIHESMEDSPNHNRSIVLKEIPEKNALFFENFNRERIS